MNRVVWGIGVRVCVCGVGGGGGSGGCIHIFISTCSNPCANSEEGVVDQHFQAKPFQTMCRKGRNGNQHPFHAIFSPKPIAPLSVNRGDIRPKSNNHHPPPLQKKSLPLQTAWMSGSISQTPPPHTHTQNKNTHLKQASPAPNSMNKDRRRSSLPLHPYPPTLSKAYVIKEGSSGPTIPPPPPPPPNPTYTQNPITTT